MMRDGWFFTVSSPTAKTKAALKADLTPQQYEWVCNKLYDLTLEYKGKPGINIYIPFYARVAKQRGMPDFDNWYNNFFLGRCFFGKFMSVAENGEAIPMQLQRHLQSRKR